MLFLTVRTFADEKVVRGSIVVPSAFKSDFRKGAFAGIQLFKKLNATEEVFQSGEIYDDGTFQSPWSHIGDPDLEWRGPVLQLAGEFVVLWPRLLHGQSGSYQFRLVSISQLWQEKVADGSGTIITAVRAGQWTQADDGARELADLLQNLIDHPRPQRDNDPILAYARDLRWSLYRDLCSAAVSRCLRKRDSITIQNSTILRGWFDSWRDATVAWAKDNTGYSWRALTCGDPEYTFARVASMPANRSWPDTTLSEIPDSEFAADKTEAGKRRIQLINDVRPVLEIIIGTSGDLDQPLPDLSAIVQAHIEDKWIGKETQTALRIFLTEVAGKDPDKVLKEIKAPRLDLVLNGLMQLGRGMAPKPSGQGGDHQ